MIEQVDRGVGQILNALEELGERENTLVVFTSDNGGTKYARPTGLRAEKHPLRGRHSRPRDRSLAGRIEGRRRIPAPAATFDLTASFTRAAGVMPPAGPPFDGVDILPHIRGRQSAPGKSFVLANSPHESHGAHMHDGSLKFVSEATGDDVNEYLFDLASDPAEENNLLASRPSDTARLKAKLAAWEEEVKAAR